MSEQPAKKLQFFISEEGPCPYIDNLSERKIFTYLSGKGAEEILQILSHHGFRRSQNVLYRPICDNCAKCKPVRIIIDKYSPSKSQRRIINRNKDIIAIEKPLKANKEQYKLFKLYLAARHIDGNMVEMDFIDYEYMVEDSVIDSKIIEYFLPDKNEGKERLVGVALCDFLFDGISMVYSFFDPKLNSRSLSKYMIIDNIKRAKNRNLPYLYLGYWVMGAKKMQYKAEFRPLEIIQNQDGWQNFTNGT